MRYADRPMLQVNAAKYGAKYGELNYGNSWISLADPSVTDDGRLMYHLDLSVFGLDGMVHIVLSDMPKTDAGDAQKA